MNYTELKQALQDYLQNTETTFVANIDTFIRQAEERIFRDVQVPDLRTEDTGTLTISQATLSVPSDLLSVISFRVTNSSSEFSYLLPKQEDFMDEAFPDGDEGVPEYYAIASSSNFKLAPIPDSTYAYQVKYYYDPPSIVTSATSWLGDNAEAALLYGSLIEAYTYEKGDVELMNQYEERYQTALRGLTDLGMVRLKRDDYRNDQRRGR